MSDFVICINNEHNPASLILGKVYPTLPDVDAAAHDMVRVIDEDQSESDGYLYEASLFAPIELPEMVKQALEQRGQLHREMSRRYLGWWMRRDAAPCPVRGPVPRALSTLRRAISLTTSLLIAPGWALVVTVSASLAYYPVPTP